MINSDFEKPIVGESVLYDALTLDIRGLLQTEFLVKFSETVRNRRTCHPDMNLTHDFNVASDAGSCKCQSNLN